MVPYYKLRVIKSCLSPEMQCNVCCTESSEHTVKLCTAVKSHPILVQLNFASLPNRMLADTIMKIHATTIIKDETINQNLLFFSPFSVVEHKCYFETLKVVFFFNEVFEVFTILQRTSQKTCLEALFGNCFV